MRRILIFSLAYFPKHVGGAEVAIQEITKRIAPEDYEFHLICLGFDSELPKEEQIGNVHVHRVGWGKGGANTADTFTPRFYMEKILFVPLAALAAWKLNRRFGFHGLWAMMSYMLFPVVIARALGLRRPYVLTLQEGDPFEHVFKRWYIALFKPLLHIGFRKAAVIQSISTYLATWARGMGFEGRLVVVPNGVDVPHFSKIYKPDEIEEAKRAMGKRPGDTYLITASRLVQKNAVDDVIRALPLLPANVYFAVLGTGPDEGKLKALAANLGVSHRVRFMGHIGHADMPRYLKAADIFIRPSLSEGMGNAFVEAMAAGLPVIATQVGGIADFLFDPDRNPGIDPTGRAVRPRDPVGIARAAERFIADRKETARIVSNAKKLVQKSYDWDRVARNMKEHVFDVSFVYTA